MSDDDRRVGPCGKHCAVVDECEARGDVIRALRAENARLLEETAQTNGIGGETTRLRDALKPFADKIHAIPVLSNDSVVSIKVRAGAIRFARSVLGE